MTGKTQLVSEGDDFYRRSALDSNDEPIHHIYVDDDENTYFSATTILNLWSDEEKKQKLQEWREKYNGEDGKEHHSDLLRFAQLQGTLLHAEVQEPYSEEQIWGKEEDMAEQELKNFGEFKGRDAWELYKDNREWFVPTVQEMIDEEIDEVLFVEDYCFHGEPAYAGQVDFVYRNKDGEVVVLDFKTSKQVGYTYLLQTNAYARVIEDALEEPVDKLQVARANPEHEDSELFSIDRDEMAIELCELVETEYGMKICLDAPYEAKDVIKNGLDWDLHHQSWNPDKKMWTIAIRNKNGTVTFDYAMYELNNQGWTVSIPDGLIETIIFTTDVEEDEINLNSFDDGFDSWGDQLGAEFDSLATQMNDKRPLTFPEDILESKAEKFDESVVEDSLAFINEHTGTLGDKHPHEILSAILVMNGSDIDTVKKVFEPEELQNNIELYSEL